MEILHIGVRELGNPTVFGKGSKKVGHNVEEVKGKSNLNL